MSDDETAGPSFLLAQHDLAHREHTRTHTDSDPDTQTNTHTHTHTHARAQQKESRHRHHQLHAKRDPATTQVVEQVVTQVVTTISVVEQIDVDINGNTITVQTRLADPSDYPWLGTLTDHNSPGATATTLASANPTILTSTAPASSSPTGQDTVPVPASTPLTTLSFSSSLAASNSTTVVTSSSSLSKVSAFSNSTITSRTSLSIHKSSSSRLSHSSFSSSTTASSTSTLTPTGLEPAGGVNTALVGSQPSSTPESSGGGNQTDVTPTPVVIGGVVGSVAGAAIIIIALLFIFRWRRRGGQMLSSRISGTGGDGDGNDIREAPPSQPPAAGGMAERRSLGFALPAALAGLTGNKRQSQKTEWTVSSTAGSERGFYRVSGRKLPSVLQSGGDGYGGEAPNEQTLSGSSFYRDSQGFYGGPGGLATPPPGVSMQLHQQPDGGLPIMRPSPARTPVTEPGLGLGLGPFADSLHTPPQPPPPPRPDGLGRSHSSQDGSHTSRFTEEV